MTATEPESLRGVEPEPDAIETTEAADSETDPVQRLLFHLEVTPTGHDRFQVPNPKLSHMDRVFGGQVAAQALRAAAATVEVDHLAHSLHAYFLRPGRPGVPIDFDVERTRDGRSFTTRRVLASQGDEVIFETSVSFHRVEEGNDYQLPLPDSLPAPADAPDLVLFIPNEIRASLPMEMRELGPSEPDSHGFYASTRRVWTRVKREVGDDPIVHQCLLTYLSDMGAVFAALAPRDDFSFERFMGASLDHAMWFHRPLRADDWFFYELQAVSNAGSRGLARGTMHGVDGVLGVSIAQEALIRFVAPPSP